MFQLSRVVDMNPVLQLLLPEVPGWMRLDCENTADHDLHIRRCLRSAAAFVEEATHRDIAPTTTTYSGGIAPSGVRFARGYVRSYRFVDGTGTTVAAPAAWAAQIDNRMDTEAGLVLYPAGANVLDVTNMPTARMGRSESPLMSDAAIIEVMSGYSFANEASVPQAIQHAILELTAAMFENREAYGNAMSGSYMLTPMTRVVLNGYKIWVAR